jgi:hypothetical protein
VIKGYVNGTNQPLTTLVDNLATFILNAAWAQTRV